MLYGFNSQAELEIDIKQAGRNLCKYEIPIFLNILISRHTFRKKAIARSDKRRDVNRLFCPDVRIASFVQGLKGLIM